MARMYRGQQAPKLGWGQAWSQEEPSGGWSEVGGRTRQRPGADFGLHSEWDGEPLRDVGF